MSIPAGRPIRSLVLDMDGVLWRGHAPLPGAGRLFEVLRAAGLSFALATNNATETPQMFRRRLLEMGLDVPDELIVTSAEATAAHLAAVFGRGAAIYAIGEAGLTHALKRHGLQVAAADGDGRAADEVVAVAAGLTRQVCYHDLALAAAWLQRGAPLFGTNPDVTLPTESGPQPGAGAIIAFLEAAGQTKATIIGKPQPILLAEALRRLGAEPAESLMVGDRLATDVAGGLNLGMQTALILTGVSTRAESAESSMPPDYIFENLLELAHFLEPAAAQ
ncbi:MAG: HAD-IIA family hydrolase [Candidatus Promineifilaceae bacterium]